MSDLALAIVIAGPTGSGKSELALSAAEWVNGEIVNCDSVQIYRYLDIGTAKTPVEERHGIPHHLIDILDPDQVFTAGDYQRAGRGVMRAIAGRGRVPIVAGGTGFYLRALLEGIFEGPPRDEELRARLTSRSPEFLHKLLRRLDAVAADRIHANDTQKVIRALEVCFLARAPITSLHGQNQLPIEGFRILKIILNPPREALAERLNARVVRMFETGLLEETKGILARGFSKNSKALESIGYRECLQHLDGAISLNEAVSLTQAATRQYAKRQRTWFRREGGAVWLEAFGNEEQTFETTKRLIENAEIL